MKRLFILLSVSFLLFSCQSSGKNPRASSPDFLADMDPVSVGSAAMQFNKLFSSALQKQEVEVNFDPRTDSVILQFKYQSVTYRQFWNKSNRLQFITALEKYKQDYEAKNLNLKGNRARRAYGYVYGRAEWGQFSVRYMMSSASLPRMDLGYLFKQDKPYFTVSMQAAEDIQNKEDGIRKRSMDITSYFTRAQADELVKLFDQQYLLSFLGARANFNTTPDEEPDYQEADWD